MRYVMTFMEPCQTNRGEGRRMAFKSRYLAATKEPQAEVIRRMLEWLDTSPFGRTLFLEDINWAVAPHTDSSIIADLTEDQYVILKLAAPTGSVRFRKESEVPIRQTSRERYLSEPMPMSRKPRLTPKPQPTIDIVKKAARSRPNLGPPAIGRSASRRPTR